MYHCDAFSPEGVYADQSIYGVLEATESQAMTPLASLVLRVFKHERGLFELEIGDESSRPFVPEILGERVVSSVLAKDVIKIHVIDLKSQSVTAQLFLAGANRVSTRLAENTLTIADDLGRVIVIDLRRNCQIRNFRI
jgi:hypothetical protein